MQRQNFQNSAHISYSKWAQHRAENGRIYLAHPVTGEVKWLWSRHHDPKTKNDYLVNTITGKREWVTKDNAHLCPLRSTQTSDRNSNYTSSSNTNPFAETKTTSERLLNKQNTTNTSQIKSNYREIAAPKSLGLTADEALMLAADSGRRYIYNKKTGTSRWLPNFQPDTIRSESNQKSLFGLAKSKKINSSPFGEDKAIQPQLGQNTSFHHSNTNITATNHLPQSFNTSTNNTYLKSENGHTNTQIYPNSNQIRNNMGSVTSTPSRPNDQVSSQENRGLSNAIDTESAIPEDPVQSKVQTLNKILDDVKTITSSSKYDMKYLRSLTNDESDKAKDGSQRLLELSEYLTQQMLKVDGVSSDGNEMIRSRRKEVVKTIIGLTDEVDELRKKL